jgi:hypothetical protein
MSEIWYLASILLTFTAYAVAVWVAWQVVEGAYWLYCKATKREY